MNQGFGTKVTPIWSQPSQSGSESVVTTEVPKSVFEEQVKEFFLATPTQLKNKIAQGKEFHRRPMSNSEYNHLIGLLKSQKNEKGELLFKHDLAAIARVVKENFNKFFPDISLDYEVGNSLEFHYEVDNILSDMYDEAVENYRKPFVVSTAEEMEKVYSPEEKNRLRELGVAFVDDKYKSVETFVPSPGNSTKQNFIKRSYQHPMLRYNLLKE